ncbi:MAG: nicotinamide-nucleotide adenylyltransferase [Candidatus Micrarchaeaceae archaeon]
MKKRFEVGLFMGRFQPFHKGHLHALAFAVSLCRNVVIGIGSSQDSGTELNPLSSKKRIGIIKAGIKGTEIGKAGIRFIEVPDFKDNDLWFEYIMGKEPDINVVFSRNRLVKSIFRRHGIAVVSPEWHARKRLSGTNIRRLIRSGKDWKGRVPEGEVKTLAKYEGIIKRAR